jgi:hypothetical protein
MPTFSAFDMKTSSGGTVKGEVTLGYGVGGVLGIIVTKHVTVQGEVIYNSISQKYKEQDVERRVNLKYLNIPVLFSLNTDKNKSVNFNIVGGPQLGISVGSDVQTTGDGGTGSSTAVVAVKKSDVGLAYGAGLDFGLNKRLTTRLTFGFRGVYGLFDISDHSSGVAANSYYILDRTHVKTYSGYIGLSILI